MQGMEGLCPGWTEERDGNNGVDLENRAFSFTHIHGPHAYVYTIPHITPNMY